MFKYTPLATPSLNYSQGEERENKVAKFDPFLSLDCTRVEGVEAQSKERKGSNFAIWQPCMTPQII